MLIEVYGKNIHTAGPGFLLMLADDITLSADGKQVKDAFYRHCKWMYEADMGGGIREWLFYCQCNQICGRLYLKFFKVVELCELSNWY